MIEVYAPFLLLLMSWEANDPQATMSIKQRLFISQAECIEAGEEVSRLRAANGDDGRKFAWKCVPQQTAIEVYRPLRPAK